MTTAEAIDYLERCADGLDPDFDKAVSLAVAALRDRWDRKLCVDCDFWDESDPRCMCDKSQWAGLTVKGNNYCGCFERRSDLLTLEAQHNNV